MKPKFDEFLLMCKARKMEAPIKEYKVFPDRRFRIDYCWPDIMLAIELEGGIYPHYRIITNQSTGKKERILSTVGGHTSGKGYESNLYKYNRMAVDGWTLLRYPPKKIDWNQIEFMYLLNKKVKRSLEEI